MGAPAPAPPTDAADGANDLGAWVRWIVESVNRLRLRKAQLEATVLVSIDQLEVALSPADVAGSAFLLSLRDALVAADSRLLAQATLRADFTATLQRHPLAREPSKIGEILVTRTFQLGPMPRSAFYAVIEGPAAIAGLELGPGLASQLVDDTRSDDALPLLAFVLRELWIIPKALLADSSGDSRIGAMLIHMCTPPLARRFVGNVSSIAFICPACLCGVDSCRWP